MTPPPSASTTTDAGGRRRRSPRGEGDQLRDELLDAAEGLLIEKGSMDAVSVRAIADAVGVTPPSLYLHFEDKDDLFFGVCNRRFEDFEAVLRQAIDGIDDPVERLRALGMAYVRYGTERAEHYQIIFGPRAHDVVGDRSLEGTAGMRALGLLVETVQAGIEAGALRDQDPWMASLTLWGAVHGAVMLLVSNGAVGDHVALPTAEELGQHVCDTIMAGLSA